MRRRRVTLGGLFLLLIAVAAAFLLPDPEKAQGDPPTPTRPPSGPTLTATVGTASRVPGALPDWLTVYFTDPNPHDDTSAGVDAHVVPLLDTATRSIDIASYDFNLPSVIDAVVRARGRGVDVRIVLDLESGEHELDASHSSTGKDLDAVKALQDAGIQVVDGGRSNGLMHDKFIIVDGRVLVVGSWNMSYNDTFRNNNNLLVVTDPTLIANYQVKFNEMANGHRFGTHALVGAQTAVFDAGGVSVANYFSPPDGVMQKLIALVNAAGHSIRFMIFTYTDGDLAAAMIARHNAGVDVRGIIESRSASEGVLGSLFCAGVPVKLDGNRYNMHHKVMIIDERIVVTGSYNFTKSADEVNDDNALVIADPALAQAYLAEFDRLDGRAKVPDAADMRCPPAVP